MIQGFSSSLSSSLDRVPSQGKKQEVQKKSLLQLPDVILQKIFTGETIAFQKGCKRVHPIIKKNVEIVETQELEKCKKPIKEVVQICEKNEKEIAQISNEILHVAKTVSRGVMDRVSELCPSQHIVEDYLVFKGQRQIVGYLNQITTPTGRQNNLNIATADLVKQLIFRKLDLETCLKNKKLMLFLVKEINKIFDDDVVGLCGTWLLGLASPELRDDEEIIFTALKNGIRAFGVASDRLKEKLKTKALALEVLRDPNCKGNPYDDIGREVSALNDDEEFLLELVRRGSTLRHLSERLMNDREFILKMVTLGDRIVNYKFEDDHEIALATVQSSATNLFHVSDRLKRDLRIIIPALHEYAGAIFRVPQDLVNHPEVQAAFKAGRFYIPEFQTLLQKEKEVLNTDPLLRAQDLLYRNFTEKKRKEIFQKEYETLKAEMQAIVAKREAEKQAGVATDKPQYIDKGDQKGL